MSVALEEITARALKLSQEERLALANRLLSDAEGADASAIEAAWDDEIVARIKAIDDGSAVGIPYEEVIRAARDRA
jgi:putative addiction module component (TIGR02574 family)